MSLLHDLEEKFPEYRPGIGRNDDQIEGRQVIPRATKTKAEFERYWPEIELALSLGWPLNAIWETLSSDDNHNHKKIHCTYPSLARMVAECDNHTLLVARPEWVVHALAAYALGYTDIEEYCRDVQKGTVLARDRVAVERISSLIKGFIDCKGKAPLSVDKLKSIFVIPAGSDENMRLFLTSPDSRVTDEVLLKKVQARAMRISEFFAINGFPGRICKGDETNETVAVWFHLECTGGSDYADYDPERDGDCLSFAKKIIDGAKEINRCYLLKAIEYKKTKKYIDSSEEYLSVVNQALKATPRIDRLPLKWITDRPVAYLWEEWADDRAGRIKDYFNRRFFKKEKDDTIARYVFTAAAYNPPAMIALWEEKVEAIAKENPEQLTEMGSFLDAVRGFWLGDRVTNKTNEEKWCNLLFGSKDGPKIDPEKDPQLEPELNKGWGVGRCISKNDMDTARFIVEMSNIVTLLDEEKKWMFVIRKKRIQALLYKYGWYYYGPREEEYYEGNAAKRENAFVALLLESWFRIWLDEKSGCYTNEDMKQFFHYVLSRYDEGRERPSEKFLKLVDEALKDAPHYDFPQDKPKNPFPSQIEESECD